MYKYKVIPFIYMLLPIYETAYQHTLHTQKILRSHFSLKTVQTTISLHKVTDHKKQLLFTIHYSCISDRNRGVLLNLECVRCLVKAL